MIWFFTFIMFNTFIDLLSALVYGHYGKKEWFGDKMCDCYYNKDRQISRRVFKMLLEKSKIAMIFVLYSVIKLKRTDDIL